MGLLSGIFMGMVVGVALIAGWSRMMTYRSTKRVAKAVEMKLMGSLSRDDLKKLCGDNFPEWVSFPAFEQVKWLNKQLSKMWPFIADAASLVIKESIEPVLEDYRPPGISKLKFHKLSLGNVPPKIEGVRVQSFKKGQITMDIDFRWGGDPNIIIHVDAHVASLPIQLKDLQFFSVIRVIFQLSEEIPCISAVVAALLSEPKPRIDYTLKAIGGSLTAIPGLSDMIDDTVETIVSDTLQWPRRIVVPLGGQDVDISDLELKPQGMTTLTIQKATSLKNMEMIGKSDPYVVVYIRPIFKYKTKVINNNLNPVWEEHFELIVEDKETQSIIFEVYDEDNFGPDKKLGVTKLPLAELQGDLPKEIELRLLPALDMMKIKDKKDRGTLMVKVLYHQFSKEEQEAAVEAEKKILEERRRMKEAGLIGSTMDALGGAASFVGTGIGAGVGLVGSGIGAGVGLVGTGIGAGAGLVGSGLGAVTGGLTKAGKFMGKTMTNQFGSVKRNGSQSGNGSQPGHHREASES